MRQFLSLLLLLAAPGLKAGPVGVSGSALFTERQKALDTLVMKLKDTGREFYKEQILKNFSETGAENLIRYREPVCGGILLYLLGSKDFYTRYKALYGLRRVPGVSPGVFLPFLSSTNELIRDMAVSSLAETGTGAHAAELEKHLEREKSPYVRAALKDAIEKIRKKRQRIFPDFTEGVLTNQPVQDMVYRSGAPLPHYEERFSRIFLPEKETAPALSFVPPVIAYEEDLWIKGKRVSFGAGGSIKHAGDDCAWFREGSSVFAVADGVIRLVHHSPDWGFLIVIEHRLPGAGFLCSVYGHLSAEITCRPGEEVKKGDKIGNIGLSYSVENGGYGAHLHFALSRGAWLKSRYDISRSLFLSRDGAEQKVKHYRWTGRGMELVFENGMSLTVDQGDASLNSYLFWLKGYDYARDLEREWIDPREFLKKHQTGRNGKP